MSGKSLKTETTAETRPKPCRTQKLYEKALGYGVWVLALCHVLMASGRYLYDYYNITRPVECWFAVLLITAAAVYPLLCKILWPETLYRLRGFFRKFCSPGQIICLVLFFWYILSCLVNSLVYSIRFFPYNDWALLDTAVNCIILYNLPKVLSPDKAKKMIDLLLHIVSFFYTAFSVWGLYCLFTLHVVTLPSGSQIGMAIDYTFDLGCLYNISAAIALSFILIAFYMIASQKLPVKILYVFALAVHTAVLLLNNARAGYVAGLAAYAMALFLIIWNNFRQKKLPVRLIAGFAASAAAAALLWVLRPMAFQLFESVTHFSELFQTRMNNRQFASVNAISPSDEIKQMLLFPFAGFLSKKRLKKFLLTAGITAGIVCAVWMLQTAGGISHLTEQPAAAAQSDGTAAADGEPEPLVNKDQAVRKITDLNNRGPVWTSALKVIVSSPTRFIFGVTPAGVSTALVGIGGLYFQAAHAHNEVLQMGTALGVPMMILFCVFLVLTGIKSVRLGLLNGEKHFSGAYILPVVFGTLFILTLVEAFLFAYFSVMSCLFFLFCGWINALEGQSDPAAY